MEVLKKKLNIDDTFTKPPPKIKTYTKIKDVMTLIENFNMMADLLFLPLTSRGNKYLFVITDLATNEFDIEPIKDKKAIHTLDALKNIIKRNKWIGKPKASIRTDNGTEFKKEFDKYLKDNNIFHSVSMPYRHQQLSAVESLNKQIGYLLNGYMNGIEKKTGKIFKDWDDDKILNLIRKELNNHRKVKAAYTEDNIFDKAKDNINISVEPKFKVGDIVHYKLSYPENALGQKQPTANFRVGDYRYSSIPKEIINVFNYPGKVPYRYQLKDMDNVTFSDKELILSKEKKQKYKVKKIIGKKKENNKTYYLVWWDGYNKKESTFEEEKELIKDGLKDMIDAFNENV